MPILENPSSMTPAEQAASQIRGMARRTFSDLARAFEMGALTFWKNPKATPAEIAAALGADGKEAFELHGKIGALLASVAPDSIQRAVSVVGQFSYNADGSVAVEE